MNIHQNTLKRPLNQLPFSCCTGEVFGMRSVFLSLALPLRMSQRDQRWSNWLWLSVSSISTTSCQQTLPPKSSPAPGLHSRHIPRDAVFIIHTRGFSGPTAGVYLPHLVSVPWLLSWYSNIHQDFNCTHTRAGARKLLLPCSSFSISCLLACSWLL